MQLIAVLSGGPASSKEWFDYEQGLWDMDVQECTTTYTNTDSIVFDNVTILNGLLGFRVEFIGVPFTCNEFQISETSVLLQSALGYNAFNNTATFDPGDLVLVDDTCQ